MARVLVVDDAPSMVSLVHLILERQGHSVIGTSDSRQALDLAYEHQPHLIITGGVMPYYDGYTVCRMLRATEQFANTPIILMSANINRAEAEAAGVNRLLSKPFHPQALIAYSRELLHAEGGAPSR
ncbi:MAG: response regulator [Chloroflexi bacterium CFX4]|nr:response regulator [Chloroflexi bacterium CFX4]MDL1922778.1 response regulator [Chloroflexi bacterium CFX3]